jgi:hypothetical protein
MQHATHQTTPLTLFCILLAQLVLINISDHHTRLKANSPDGGPPPLVMGCLLGSQDGRAVDVANSFEIKFTEALDGGFEIDTPFLLKKAEQCEWPAGVCRRLGGRQHNRAAARRGRAGVCSRLGGRLWCCTQSSQQLSKVYDVQLLWHAALPCQHHVLQQRHAVEQQPPAAVQQELAVQQQHAYGLLRNCSCSDNQLIGLSLPLPVLLPCCCCCLLQTRLCSPSRTLWAGTAAASSSQTGTWLCTERCAQHSTAAAGHSMQHMTSTHRSLCKQHLRAQLISPASGRACLEAGMRRQHWLACMLPVALVGSAAAAEPACSAASGQDSNWSTTSTPLPKLACTTIVNICKPAPAVA